MNIQKGYDYAKNPYHGPNKTATEESQKKTTTASADVKTDSFDPAETTTYKASYNKGSNRTDNADFRSRAGMSARQLKNDAVRNMVQSQMNAQVSGGSGYKPMFGGNSSIMAAFQAAEATSAKHDDFWGVEATAERLFTFASSLAGDCEKTLGAMRDAFMKGFRAAEGSSAGGGRGKLPPISYQTRDRVLEMFDKRFSELAAKKNPPVTAPPAAN